MTLLFLDSTGCAVLQFSSFVSFYIRPFFAIVYTVCRSNEEGRIVLSVAWGAAIFVEHNFDS